MKKGQWSSSYGPVWDFFELPKKGDSSEKHVNVVINPMKSLHQSVTTLVTVETMLYLQTWDDEID
jgi:hypothetical protein